MERERIMKQIELETEKKVIIAYKTGKLQMPVISNDCKTISPIINAEKQIDVLKDIMSEGVANFEDKAKRKISYAEMREMFG